MGYYFISIGGSGAKVMESLTHLCAAGFLPNKIRQESLYVMAIDPDVGNGNLNRSQMALKHLEAFQEASVGNDTPLFKTRVVISNPDKWNPAEHDQKLDDIMAYQAYQGKAAGDLYEALYTRAERSTKLNEGFRGHPSIGAAVMAKKVVLGGQNVLASQPWGEFCERVKSDAAAGTAKIFLAGSIFGGTGASGMPTMARLLKNTFKDYADRVFIGGAFVLPFFSFPSPPSDGQVYAASKNFLTNTKAALNYYSMQNTAYQAMYFIGDNVLAQVDQFSAGAAEQKNDAHIVDLYGALAAIHFYQTPAEQMAGRSDPLCYDIAHKEENAFNWEDWPEIVSDGEGKIDVKQRFAQFARFVFSYIHLVRPVLGGLASGKLPKYKYPWFSDYLDGVDISLPEVEQFGDYTEEFVRWLAQIQTGQNNRSINFLHRESFSVESGTPRISASFLPTCVFDDNSEVTMHEIWYRLTERPCKEESAKGFGRFLRALYDCCANEAKR